MTLIVVVTGWQSISPQVDAVEVSPTTDRNRPVMVALGDSFMAGEGTGIYLRGTSTSTNICHRSSAAYPYRVAQELDYRLVFAACSGAVTDDILSDAQWPESPDDVLGGAPQIRSLQSSIFHDTLDEVDLVLIGIGGNDAQFGEIVRTCITQNCDQFWEAWLTELETINTSLDAVYDEVKATVADHTRVLVTTYPAPMIDAPCGALGQELTIPEVRWVLQRFLPRLNDIIRFQADVHGFKIVEMEDLFVGLRLCEVAYKEAAINAFALQRIDDERLASLSAGPLVQGSFHPNVRGHALMTSKVLEDVHGDPPEAPTPPGEPPSPGTALPPGEAPLPGVPPPNVPPEIGVPFDEPVPDEIACTGTRDELTQVVVLDANEERFVLEADPDTTLCWREQFGDWREQKAPDSGVASISTDPILEDGSAAIEVYYTSGEDDIDKLVLYPPNGYTVEPRPRVSTTNVVRLVAVSVLALAVLVVLVQLIRCLACRLKYRRRAQPCAPPVNT